jgi:Fe-S-cluster containining protein
MEPDAASVFRAALDTYERERDQAAQQQRYRVLASGAYVTCGRGCSNCCSQMVAIVLADALSIARWLIKTRPRHELRRIVARLQEDGEAQRPSGPVEWLQRETPCTFLSTDGSCGVYPVRPLNCRRMLVSTPAAWCHPSNLLRAVKDAATPLPKMENWPEFDPVIGDAQEVVRPLLRAAGIEGDLPPAPLPLAVAAALHALMTGQPEALRSWAEGKR